MKRFALALLAIASCVTTASYSLAQSQRCDCNQGGCQSEGIYQPTEWNSCQSCNSCQSGNHRGIRRQSCQSAQQCNEPRGSRFASMWTRPLFPRSCAAQCCATKAFPDAGWAPPAHYPVNHDGAWYGSYVPQHAYGTPRGGFVASYPTVYQPTDTTQLGYYYNKVPTWQTRNDMMPPVPIPGNFHSRICPPGGHGCHAYHGASYAPAPSSCQSCNSGYSYSGPQYTSPAGHKVARSAGPQKQGLLGGFRLTSMTEVFD